MAITNVDGIVTPDEGTTADPTVYLAAMADSISQGIGERVTRQEQAIGLKASIAAGVRVKYNSGIIAPFGIHADGTSNFIQGMELNGGVVTITAPGMYLISASAALNPTGGAYSPENLDRSIALQLKHNDVDISGSEVSAHPFLWQTAQSTAVILCAVGDTLHVGWYSAGPGGSDPDPTEGAALSTSPSMQALSIVLITPVAV